MRDGSEVHRVCTDFGGDETPWNAYFPSVSLFPDVTICIAANSRAVSSQMWGYIQSTQVLLGQRRKRKMQTLREKEKLRAEEEDNVEDGYDLLRPGEIAIADDAKEWQLFGDAVFCCPQEDALEGTQFVSCSS
jgi:hypothetical protein